MKKLVLLVLTLALLVSCCAVAEEYRVGGVINGFELKEIHHFDFLNAELYYFQHVRTGAEVLYVANEDNNRMFEIAFRTPANDNTGVAEIVKSAVLDGSEKYPSDTLFYSLYSKTYNTLLGASADNGLTYYPVSSLSEEQLLQLADYYASCCFHPLLNTDERIFRNEGWRYSLAGEEDPLKLYGTALNNARSATKMGSAALNNHLSLLNPGSILGNDVAGSVKDMLTLTWEDAKTYHAKYYHPSNSLTLLYGKLAHVEDFLALLDDCFEGFERTEIVIADDGYTPLTEPVTAEFAYPAARNIKTEKVAIVYYGFACSDVTEKDEHVLDLLTTLLIDDDSVFMRRLGEVFPDGNFTCFVNSDTPDFEVTFGAANLNREDAELFRQTVDEVLEEIASQGLDEAFVSAAASRYNVQIVVELEKSNVGEEILREFAYFWQSEKDYLAYDKMLNTLSSFEQYNAENLYAEAVTKYLLDNERSAMAITYPEPGLKEENDAALTEMLAETKAQMTEEAIETLIASGSETEIDNAAEYLDQFLVINTQNLPEEIREYDYSDEVAENGVRYIDVEADVNKVGRAELLLDLAGLPQEDIHWVQLYTYLVSQLPTSAHTQEELQALKERYLYEYLLDISVYGTAEDCSAWVKLGFTGLENELNPGYELFYELLYDTQFTDAEMIAGIVTRYKDTLRQEIANNPVNYMVYRAFGTANKGCQYYAYAKMLDYYEFLAETEQKLSEAPEEVLSGLRRAQEFVHNSANAVVTYVGTKVGAEMNHEWADAFLSRLDCVQREQVSYDFPGKYQSNALMIDGLYQFNIMFSSLKDMGLEERSGAWNIIGTVIQDWVVYPHMRDELGLYFIYHGMQDYGLLTVSNYDSYIQETFELLEKLPDLIESTEITQEMLDDYILAYYAQYATRTGELSGGSAWADALLRGNDPYEKLQRLHEMKQVTVEDIKQYVEIYRKAVENSIRYTATNATQIYSQVNYFDNILNPFDLANLSENEFVDCAEDDPDYEIIRYLYEQGFMDPLSQYYFGMDETATYGDLYTAFYVMLGMEKDQEKAIAFFIEHNFLTEDSLASDIMEREDLALSLYNFARALGMNAYDVSLDGYEDADDVDPQIAGKVGWVLENGLMPSIGSYGKYYISLDEEVTRAELAEIFYDFQDRFM